MQDTEVTKYRRIKKIQKKTQDTQKIPSTECTKKTVNQI